MFKCHNFFKGNDVDQVFSILCQELKTEIKSLDDLFDKLKSAPIVPKAEVEHFLYTWDWKSFVEDHLTEKSLENHSFYHSFKFFHDGDTVLMQAKHLPQDIEWTPSTGIRLVKESAVFEPVVAAEFRIEQLNLTHIFRDLMKYFQRLPVNIKIKVSSSWDALRSTLENLPGKRMNIAKMKISELPKQVLNSQPDLPEHFEYVIEKEIPELKGDIFPETLDEGDFEEEIIEGLDVVCYTKSKSSNRPWLGKVTEILPEQTFVIQWYSRKRGNQNEFHGMEEDGKPFTSVQENACVILWGFSVKKSEKCFIVSNYWLSKIKNEYAVYDKNDM